LLPYQEGDIVGSRYVPNIVQKKLDEKNVRQPHLPGLQEE
jgi:hypothetical protein